MKSILEELYHGNVSPLERLRPTNPEYYPTNHKIEEVKQYLKGKISQDDQNRFEELEELYCRSTSIELTDMFIIGFRLAALIMTEVYSGQDKITRG